MKKLGIVLLALALCGGFLAAEKATWSVSGWASTEWGYKFATQDTDWDKDWDSGFKTEAGASLRITFLGDTSRVGEGVGDWRGYIELNDFSIDNVANDDVDFWDGNSYDEDDTLPGVVVTMPEVVAKILYKDFLYIQLTSASTKADYAEPIDDLLGDGLSVAANGGEAGTDGADGGIAVGYILEDAGTIIASAHTKTTWGTYNENDWEDDIDGNWSYYSFRLAYEGVAIADMVTPKFALSWSDGRYAGAHFQAKTQLAVLEGLEITLGSDFVADLKYLATADDTDEFAYNLDASLEAGLMVAEGFSVGAAAYLNHSDARAALPVESTNVILDAAIEIEEASGDEGLLPIVGLKVEAAASNILNITEDNKLPWKVLAIVDATFGDFEVEAGYEYMNDAAVALGIDQESDYLKVTYTGIDKTSLYAKYELADIADVNNYAGAVWVGAKVTF